MLDDAIYTRRDLIYAERIAFESGWRHHRSYPTGRAPIDPALIAESAYPLPKVTGPRVVTDSQGTRFRVVHGDLNAYNPINGRWFDVHHTAVTPERVRLWADLLDNPTVEVDE